MLPRDRQLKNISHTITRHRALSPPRSISWDTRARRHLSTRHTSIRIAPLQTIGYYARVHTRQKAPLNESVPRWRLEKLRLLKKEREICLVRDKSKRRCSGGTWNIAKQPPRRLATLFYLECREMAFDD